MRLADGLRGPFLSPIYLSRGLSDMEINILFSITFFSSAVFCIPVGYLADRRSKRAAIMLACCIDAISCVSRFSSDYYFLVFGHILSGISNCALFSTLESWIISEHAFHGYDQLQQTLSKASSLFGITYIICGIFAHAITMYFSYDVLLYLSAIFGVFPIIWIKINHSYSSAPQCKASQHNAIKQDSIFKSVHLNENVK